MKLTLYTCFLLSTTILPFSYGQSFLLQNLAPSNIYQCLQEKETSTTDLEVNRCDTSNSSQIITASGSGLANPPGSFLLLPSGQCLTAAGNEEGSHVNQADCVGSPNQQWYFVYNQTGSKFFQVVSTSSAKCMTLKSNGLELDDCVDCKLVAVTKPNQLWRQVDFYPIVGNLQNVGNTAKCLYEMEGSGIGLQNCPSPVNPNVRIVGGNSPSPNKIKFEASGLCMSISAGNTMNGGSIDQENCSDDTWTQDWEIVNGNLPGPFQLKNPLSSKCLTPGDDGTYMFNFDCASDQSSNANQFWNILVEPTWIGHIKIFGTGGCLQPLLGSGANNAALSTLLLCTQNQRTTVDSNLIYGYSDGHIKLANGKCMSGASIGAVKQNTCDNNLSNQKWKIIGGNVNGLVQIKNLSTGKCLTAGPLGLGLTQNSCVGNVNEKPAQFWTFY